MGAPPTLQSGDSVAAALVEAIRTGDLESMMRMLADKPGLASARIESAKGGARTLLCLFRQK